MAYLTVSDFKAGLDTRRPDYATDEGSLVELENAHVTAGGDIEGRKEFVLRFPAVTGMVGMHAKGDSIQTFGTTTISSGSVPAGQYYAQLTHPTAAAMSRVLDTENFGKNVYVIAEFDDGSLWHYYAGALTDHDLAVRESADNTTVAEWLSRKINANPYLKSYSRAGSRFYIQGTPGLNFTATPSVVTFSGGTSNPTLTATVLRSAVAAAAGTAAACSFRITAGAEGHAHLVTGVTVNGVDILGAHVPYQVDDDTTAQAVADQINRFTSNVEYVASRSTDTVTITALTSGTAPNGYVLAVATAGSVTVADVVNPMAGGVNPTSAVSKIYAIDVGVRSIGGSNTWDIIGHDQFIVAITGTPDNDTYRATMQASVTGRFARSHLGKMYTINGRELWFSETDDVTDWTTGTSSGFIAASNQTPAVEELTGLGIYQNRLVIFGSQNIQIWQVDPDPAEYALLHILPNTGTLARRAVVAYGNNDVLYLAPSGIRSIRSREVSGTPYANDIGNPIDSLIRAKLDEAGGREYYNAISVVNPLDGRFWCAVYDTIYVLSHYPDKRIVAWSVYPMSAKILGMVATSESVFVQLAGGNIYQYGGEWGDTYPAAGAADVTVRLPYLTAGKPAHEKALMGLDIMAEGVWSVEVRLNPADDSVVTGPLRTQRLFTGLTRIPLAGRTTHFAPVLTAVQGGQVMLSSLTIHYTTGEAE